MDGYEMKALHNCHHNLLQDLDPNTAFLSQLINYKVVTRDQREEIEHEATRRNKVAKILDILPHRGPRAFENFVRLLKLDYDWLADKLEKELIRERIYLSTEINEKLSQVINHHLCIIVYGNNRHIATPSSNHPLSIVNKLNEIIHTLHQRCVRALELQTKDGNSLESIPNLIDKRIQEMHDIISGLKSEISHLKKQNKKQEENKQLKEINNLRRDIKTFKEKNKKQENLIKSKDKKIKDLEKENTKLKSKIEEFQQNEQELTNGNMVISEMFASYDSYGGRSFDTNN